jgi:hypothetical protein
MFWSADTSLTRSTSKLVILHCDDIAHHLILTSTHKCALPDVHCCVLLMHYRFKQSLATRSKATSVSRRSQSATSKAIAEAELSEAIQAAQKVIVRAAKRATHHHKPTPRKTA